MDADYAPLAAWANAGIHFNLLPFTRVTESIWIPFWLIVMEMDFISTGINNNENIDKNSPEL